ncbi:MAG: very short patch repair endonuclease [Treponema sp.]|nr:very short patch repair endonuclease [Treponema sp.]
MDTLTPEQRHKCMSRIRSKNTSIEILLCKALWREGVRYRKNYFKLPGKPDIAVTKYKIAIFCDGELWHGKNWVNRKDEIKTNNDYWVKKIERNIERDNKVEKELERMGWVIFRYWGNDIKNNLSGCVNEIKEAIYNIKNGIFYPEEEMKYLYAVEIEPEYSHNDIKHHPN